MSAPCGRQVVKISLQKIKKEETYNILKAKFPVKFFWKGSSKTKIIYYKDGEKKDVA